MIGPKLSIAAVDRRGTALAFVALIAVVSTPLGTLRAQLPTTKLWTVYPAGAKIGAKTQIQLGGQDLEDVTAVYFSHPMITAKPVFGAVDEFTGQSKPVANTFEVSVGNGTPPGIYEIWAEGRFGLSNPRRFVVSKSTEVVESAGNSKPDQAIELKLNEAVHGRVDANARDHFKFTAKAGQSYAVNCWSGKIDSRLHSVLTVAAPSGNQIARSLDRNSAIVHFKAESDGDYIVTVEDHTFRGGSEYFYRVAVQQGPYVDAVWPPVVHVDDLTKENKASVHLIGRNLPSGEDAGLAIGKQKLHQLKAEVTLPAPNASVTAKPSSVKSISLSPDADYRFARLPFETPFPPTVAVTDQRVEIEREPNDTSHAQSIQVPCVFAGRFYPARDRDCIQFEAKKGDDFWIEVQSNQFGHNTDVAMIVEQVKQGADGKQQTKRLNQADDDKHYRRNDQNNEFNTASTDPSFQLKVSEDGTYRVRVSDQFGGTRADPRHAYQISIRKPNPAFEVAAWIVERSPDPKNQQLARVGTPSLRQADTLVLDIEPTRFDGFNSEIIIRAEQLPSGVQCPALRIAPGTNKAKLTLSANPDAPPSNGSVRLVAAATLDGKTIEREVRFGTLLWNSDNVQNSKPATRLASELRLSVTNKDAVPIGVFASQEVHEMSVGGTLAVPLKVHRPIFKGELKLDAKEVPGDSQPKQVSIAKDATEGKFEIGFANAKVKPGLYAIRLRGQAKFKHNRNPDAVARAEKEKQAIEKAAGKLATALAEANKALEAKNKLVADATIKRDAANKQVQTIQVAGSPTEEQLKAARDAAMNAQKELDKVTKNRGEVQSKQKTLDEKSKRAEAAKQAAAKRFEDAKNRNNPKDVNAIVNSTPILVRVVKSPVAIKMGASSLTVGQNNKATLPISIERKYSFADEVRLELAAEKIPQISAEPVVIAKDKTEANLVIQSKPDAPVGTHNVPIKVKLKFGNVDIETTETISINLAASAQK